MSSFYDMMQEEVQRVLRPIEEQLQHNQAAIERNSQALARIKAQLKSNQLATVDDDVIKKGG